MHKRDVFSVPALPKSSPSNEDNKKLKRRALTPETSAIKGSHVSAAIGYGTLGDNGNTGKESSGNAGRKQEIT
ncbi:hypothetical protein FQN49_005133, partial [Arthroderma sp. PD_2]